MVVPVRVSLALSDQLGQAEIEDLDLTGGGHQQIGRFDVTVNDTRGVGCGQSPGALERQMHRRRRGQRSDC